MKSLSVFLPIIAFGLVSCDATKPDAELPMRADIVAQCEQGAEGVGVPVGRIPGVCNCSADKLLDGDSAAIADVDSAQMQQIVTTCIQESGTGEVPVAAEQSNG